MKTTYFRDNFLTHWEILSEGGVVNSKAYNLALIPLSLYLTFFKILDCGFH